MQRRTMTSSNVRSRKKRERTCMLGDMSFWQQKRSSRWSPASLWMTANQMWDAEDDVDSNARSIYTTRPMQRCIMQFQMVSFESERKDMSSAWQGFWLLEKNTHAIAPMEL